jgi:hypothetical protein
MDDPVAEAKAAVPDLDTNLKKLYLGNSSTVRSVANLEQHVGAMIRQRQEEKHWHQLAVEAFGQLEERISDLLENSGRMSLSSVVEHQQEAVVQLKGSLVALKLKGDGSGSTAKEKELLKRVEQMAEEHNEQQMNVKALLEKIDEDMSTMEMDRDKAKSRCVLLEQKCARLEERESARVLQLKHHDEMSSVQGAATDPSEQGEDQDLNAKQAQQAQQAQALLDSMERSLQSVETIHETEHMELKQLQTHLDAVARAASQVSR